MADGVSVLRRVDAQTLLALAVIFYAVFVLVSGSNLLAAGLLQEPTWESLSTAAVYTFVLALVYLIYHGVYDQSRTILSYEYADRKTSVAFILVGIVLAFGFRFIVPYSSVLTDIVIAVLSLYPLFIAFAENMFFIAVVGDYVYDRIRSVPAAAIVVGVLAAAIHATVPVILPGYSLLWVSVQFAFWTVASIYSRSTLPADVTHLIVNAAYLLSR